MDREEYSNTFERYEVAGEYFDHYGEACNRARELWRATPSPDGISNPPPVPVMFGGVTVATASFDGITRVSTETPTRYA